MKANKVILILLAALVALAGLGSSWAFALAKADEDSLTERISFQGTYDLFLGKAGVFMTSSNYSGTAELKRPEFKKEYHRRGLDFTKPLLEFRLFDPDDEAFETVWGLNYVYFNLDSQDLAAWKDGELGIYRWDPETRSWETCSSFLVSDPSARHGRLTCVITFFGVYGLGRER